MYLEQLQNMEIYMYLINPSLSSYIFYLNLLCNLLCWKQVCIGSDELMYLDPDCSIDIRFSSDVKTLHIEEQKIQNTPSRNETNSTVNQAKKD